MYKLKNKISINKKLIKCKSSLFSYYKCYNEAIIVYNNESICKYHYEYLLGIYCDICGLTNKVCICNKDIKFIETEDEIKILNNIDIYINDKYYFNKYEGFDMKETIKNNMGLCYEDNCYNIVELNEDHCKKHIDEQNIDEYDENGVKIVFKEYDKYKTEENYLGRPNYYGGIIKFMYKGIIYNK
jgi:hypothetical protein